MLSSDVSENSYSVLINLRAANMILAHDSPLAALAFDASGTKLATASEKGTVIRVFSIPEGQKLFEFRGGVKRCVSICSLTFSVDGMFLSTSSNTETVHIFRLEAVREKPPEEPTIRTSYFGKVLMASASYLPSQVTEKFNQGRAILWPQKHLLTNHNYEDPTVPGRSLRWLFVHVQLGPPRSHRCALMCQHRLDGSMKTTSKIVDSASHDCPLATQIHGTAAAKGACMPSSPIRLGKGQDANLEAYTDDLGAVGVACLEDEASALRSR